MPQEHTATETGNGLPGMGHPGTSIPSGLQRLVSSCRQCARITAPQFKVCDTGMLCGAGQRSRLRPGTGSQGGPVPHAPSLENSGVRASAPRRATCSSPVGALMPLPQPPKSAGQRHVRYSRQVCRHHHCPASAAYPEGVRTGCPPMLTFSSLHTMGRPTFRARSRKPRWVSTCWPRAADTAEHTR